MFWDNLFHLFMVNLFMVILVKTNEHTGVLLVVFRPLSLTVLRPPLHDGSALKHWPLRFLSLQSQGQSMNRDTPETLGEPTCHFPGGLRSSALLPCTTSIYFQYNVTFINAFLFNLHNNPLRIMIVLSFFNGHKVKVGKEVDRPRLHN